MPESSPHISCHMLSCYGIVHVHIDHTQRVISVFLCPGTHWLTWQVWPLVSWMHLRIWWRSQVLNTRVHIHVHINTHIHAHTHSHTHTRLTHRPLSWTSTMLSNSIKQTQSPGKTSRDGYQEFHPHTQTHTHWRCKHTQTYSARIHTQHSGIQHAYTQIHTKHTKH